MTLHLHSRLAGSENHTPKNDNRKISNFFDVVRAGNTILLIYPAAVNKDIVRSAVEPFN